jgi:hypothetical protein
MTYCDLYHPKVEVVSSNYRDTYGPALKVYGSLNSLICP